MSYRAPAREKCHACGKTVYAMEMMKADNLIFHKQCMKCTECNKTLSLGNYAALEGKYFCKPHFKQLFTLKGNYSEGFGEEQHKMKWIKKEEGAATGEEQAAPAAKEEPEAAAPAAEEKAEAAPVAEEEAAPAAEEEAAPAAEEEAAPAVEEEAAPAVEEEAAPAAEEEAAAVAEE